MKARCLAVLAALGCGLGVQGCFSPGDQLAEAGPEESALARHLLSALGAANSMVVDGALADPAATPTTLALRPAKLSLAPLATGTLVVTVLGLPAGSRVATTLLSWPGGDRHLEVPRVSTSADPDTQIEIDYTVSEQVCSRLCDRVHRADLLVSVALADGRVVGRVPFPVELDCSGEGNPALCDLPVDSPAFTVGAALDAYRSRYCECQGLTCTGADTGFPSLCLLDLMASHPDDTRDLGRCITDRLEATTECLDTTCDIFGCVGSNQLQGMTASCGLEHGPLDDELMACFIDSRGSAEVLQCNPSFSLETVWFCDGNQDCEGAFDELACPLARQCDQFSVVQPAWICNGSIDCGSGMDEQDCAASPPVTPGRPIPFD